MSEYFNKITLNRDLNLLREISEHSKFARQKSFRKKG